MPFPRRREPRATRSSTSSIPAPRTHPRTETCSALSPTFPAKAGTHPELPPAHQPPDLRLATGR